MKPLDKKQIPQVAALAVLALAFFGYFISKMILPTPASAGSRPVPAVTASATAAKAAASAVLVADAGTALTAPPPSPGMRDPFVPGVSDKVAPVAASVPAVRTASPKATGAAPLTLPFVPTLPSASIRELKSAPVGVPSVPSLPSVVPALPVAPPPPTWVVTGVLQSGSEHIAILRSGEARRFVKTGDSVDGEFVVARVTRDTVVLRHGTSRFTLPLGGAKPAAPKRSQAFSGLPVLPAAAPTPTDTPAAAPGPDISRVDTVPARNFPVAQAVVTKRRVAACPTVRVADYLSAEVPPILDATAPRTLLSAGVDAPDFSLPARDGNMLSLSQFRGHVVLLHFWAAWDAHSRQSLAPMAQIQQQFASQGLTVLSVDSWDNNSLWQETLNLGDPNSPSMLFDPGVSNKSVAVRSYHVPSLPAFYVIDRTGRVAGGFVGYGPDTTRTIKAILAKLGVS